MPALTAANMHKPALFQAKVAFVLPDDKAAELELVLKSADGKERKHKMELINGTYRATVVPVPAPEGPRVVRVTAIFAEGSVSGSITDLEFKVGTKAVKLSEVRRVRTKPAQALLEDGKTVEGALAGLDTLRVRLGGPELALALADIVELRCEPVSAAESVSYTIVATVGGKEVGRLSDTLTAAAPAPRDLPRVDANPVIGDKDSAIAVAPLKQDKEERPLPSAAEAVCAGGGGRFLILHLPRERKLAVFDVNEAKIVKYVPVAEDSIKFAAGRDRLIVYLPTANVFQRWNLNTLEKEATVSSPAKGTAKAVLMGSASAGPLVVAADQGLQFFDPVTLKETGDKVLDQRGQQANVGVRAGTELRISADGSLISVWYTDQSPTGFTALVREGATYRHRYEHVTLGALLPSPGGRVLYTNEGIYTPEGKATGKKEGGYGHGVWYVPALHGPYYLSLRENGDKKPGDAGGKISLFLHLEGDQRPLVAVPPVNELDALIDWTTGRFRPFDQHVLFVPDAQLLVVIPATKDKLLLRRLNLDQLLDKADVDYLFVKSQPVRQAERGATYTYPVVVRSKKGGVKYKLDSGPKGMKIGPDGKISWEVPANFDEQEADVIVSISDASEQEIFHTFKIAVLK